MTIRRLAAVILIFVCTALGWFVLGATVALRSTDRSESLRGEVADTWGPPMEQPHPVVYYLSPTSRDGKKRLAPIAGEVRVTLSYQPKKKGLLRYRTYAVDFQGDYRVDNPTPITQTLYVTFNFPTPVNPPAPVRSGRGRSERADGADPGDPAPSTSYENFSFQLGGAASTQTDAAEHGGITEAVTLGPGASAPLRVTYRSRGLNRWGYGFGDATRVRNFVLTMQTDFREINFPAGSGSPTDPPQLQADGGGWRLRWSYPDVIGAPTVAMTMPNLLNPGPVATRITFFAPVSLLFFFTVIVLVSLLWSVDLHPMNYFFLAAGFFAFPSLFAYTVDLMPPGSAFALASAASLALVGGYLWAATGRRFALVGIAAQFGYLVLFSSSFFFEGLTGITITVGAVVTLALLMALTAKVNWAAKFVASARRPPPVVPVPSP